MSVQHIFTTPIAEYSWDKDPVILNRIKEDWGVAIDLNKQKKTSDS